MRFLTREWHERQSRGDLGAAAMDSFNAHVDSIAHRLPHGLAALVEAGGSSSFHDGRIVLAEIDGDSLALVIQGYDWTTDLPVAPRRFTIRYERAEPTQGATADLLEILGRPELEILYAELDIIRGDAFEHRMLLWPPELGEIAIAFQDATVELGDPGPRDNDGAD
jgi:hypothetical protein